MANETTGGRLSAHAGAKVMTLDEIRTLPAPKVVGNVHKPVPHHVLVDSLVTEANERGWDIAKQQLAVGGQEKDLLFGVLDLAPQGDDKERGEKGLSLGFRNSTNSTLAIKVVAGNRVFVCDNLALSGDMIALKRRNTKLLDLKAELKAGFDKFLQHAQSLDKHIARLQAEEILDLEAKARIFDIFAEGILPLHLLNDVGKFYFEPGDDMTDVHPRTLWGLHNAFTRAMKELSPARAFTANVELGQAFGMVG